MDTWWTAIVLIILIALSAFFSASETAYASVNKIRLKTMADDGDRRAARALPMAERFDRTLSVILVGNNVVNIAAASTATLIASSLFGPTGVAISTVVMTIVILIFGEVLPKSYAKQFSESTALGVSMPLGILIRVLYPVAWFFMQLQELLPKLFGHGNQQPSVTEQELMTIIETIEEEGVIDEEKSDLVQSALTFDDRTVYQILTPRVDLVAIDVADPPEEVRKVILEERFSRIPVYENTIDNIIGILQTRDYLEAALRGDDLSDLHGMLTQPLFVHKTKKASKLLSEFREERTHMAVVIDDYGGTMGIVTLEDLLEELVGEIWDEDEEKEEEFVKVGEDVYEVSGDCEIEKAFDEIGFEDKNFESEYSSVGGWALEEFGRIPEVGDSFEYQGIRVTVLEMDDQRVVKVRMEYPYRKQRTDEEEKE